MFNRVFFLLFACLSFVSVYLSHTLLEDYVISTEIDSRQY
jgi:hypothetical protein